NIRQLENVIRRLLLQARGLPIQPEQVRLSLQNPKGDETGPSGSLHGLAADLLARAQRGELSDAHARVLEEAEKEVITQAIELARGNQAQAARWLGISRLTLREKLTHLGLRQRTPTSP
ncbi:MAG TPA: helix-turn-helix domain-containing protein, partial [Candidatus Limnocylindria bacterium]|nr:helix-turn-helix domain-containing protein [Candidatus Limnocylindria bacterium]